MPLATAGQAALMLARLPQMKYRKALAHHAQSRWGSRRALGSCDEGVSDQMGAMSLCNARVCSLAQSDTLLVQVTRRRADPRQLPDWRIQEPRKRRLDDRF
jgi:hypothetical protein